MKFAKPEVGRVVRVTTRSENYLDPSVDPRPYHEFTYVGMVLEDTRWTGENCFEMVGTEDPERVPFREIDLKSVIALEYEDGSPVGAGTDHSDDVWEVAGSRGNTYVVRRRNGKMTCTCPGFQFRGMCKHVKEKMA